VLAAMLGTGEDGLTLGGAEGPLRISLNRPAHAPRRHQYDECDDDAGDDQPEHDAPPDPWLDHETLGMPPMSLSVAVKVPGPVDVMLTGLP